MRVAILCPAPRGSRLGNRVTALRWRRMLRELGHEAFVTTELRGRWDVLLALHALKSADAIERARKRPGARIVLALTGTDVHRDIHQNPRALASIDRADRIIVLHPFATRELSPRARRKTT